LIFFDFFSLQQLRKKKTARSCCSKPEEKQQQGSCAPPAAAGAVTHEDVSKYYSENIQKTSDLVTAACCVSSTTSLPKRHRDVIKEIHPEVNDKFYGCGSTVPPMVDGCTVLDLGCGTGRDVFLASALVGKDGRAIGIDMTASQVEVATRHQQFHADKFLGEGRYVVGSGEVSRFYS
jgi:SAM-dependent methyltransferase